MRIASVLSFTIRLLIGAGSASTTVSAQDQQPFATATSPGIGHFGSLFTSPKAAAQPAAAPDGRRSGSVSGRG
jgi:hypothetical protein